MKNYIIIGYNSLTHGWIYNKIYHKKKYAEERVSKLLKSTKWLKVGRFAIWEIETDKEIKHIKYIDRQLY